MPMPAPRTAVRTAVRVAAWCLAALALSAGGGRAQPPDRDRLTFSDQVSVQQVLVPVVVRSRGRYVRNLERKDFRLFVDGRPAPIESFESGSSAPVHLLILQDVSGSMGVGRRLEWSRAAVECLLARSGPNDRFSLVTFAAGGLSVQGRASADPGAVRGWIAGWHPYGRTGLHDAVAQIPALGAGTGDRRRAVVLLTDGNDNASTVTPSAARDSARRAELPVYVFASGTWRRPAEDEGDGPLAPLQLLAYVTGGRYVRIAAAKDVDAGCERVAEELRFQYVLGFSTAGRGGVQPRRLRVEVPGKRRKITFRREYLGGLPEPPAGVE